MAKRQTIWLSTMMVLSLMLIGFYTVNNDVKEVNTGQQEAATAQPQASDAEKGAEQAVTEASDFFVSYHIEETQRVSEKEEQLQTVIATSTSNDEVDKAKQELATLQTNLDKIEQLEDKIVKEQNVPDAIVEMKDDKVNVIVQAQELDKTNVVKIMNMVSTDLGVSARKVSVSAHE